MDKLITPFRQAFQKEDGYALAEVLSPVAPSSDPNRLIDIQRCANSFTIQPDLRSSLKSMIRNQQEREIWVDIFVHYWKAINDLLAAEELASAADSQSKEPDWLQVYNSWKELLNFIHRGYSQSQIDSWTIPLLYTVSKHLRVFAIRADTTVSPSTALSSGLDDIAIDDESTSPNLEDCARQINRIFALVTQDRAPPPNRKYGTYYIATLLFRTYFRLNSISLCKNIIRTIDVASSSPDMPTLDLFPKAHQVSYRYYVGVYAFLDERYEDALTHLSSAYGTCLAGPRGQDQAQRILWYLIPAQLLVRHRLPSPLLLAQYPDLEGMYARLAKAIREGDMGSFDASLLSAEDALVRRRVYLTLERTRDICLRNLLRRVYLLGGVDDAGLRRSRFPIAEFGAALRVVGIKGIEDEEVEALVAGLIYKNLMKGYVSRPHGMVVLSKKGDVFPGTGV